MNTPPPGLRQLIAEAAAESGIRLSPFEIATLSNQVKVRAARSATSSLRLPPRLFDVLQGLAVGESIGETAQRLCISEDTVKTHRRRLYARLGAKSGPHAVAIAGRAGLPLQVGDGSGAGRPIAAIGGRS